MHDHADHRAAVANGPRGPDQPPPFFFVERPGACARCRRRARASRSADARVAGRAACPASAPPATGDTHGAVPATARTR